MIVIDVKKAHLKAPATSAIYVELPKEDQRLGEEGMCGLLKYSMYGTRDAAKNWAMEVEKTLVNLGFKVGVSSPSLFHHPSKEIPVICHGDDFVATGERRHLEWLERALRNKFDCKSKWIGPRETDPKSQQVLGRIITRTDEGIAYEADPRHAETLIEAMGLKDAKPLSSPGSREPGKEGEEEMTKAD